MKNLHLLRTVPGLLLILLTFNGCSKSGATSAAKKLTDDRERASYAIGMDIGSGFKEKSLDLDPGLLSAGLQDAMSDRAPLLSEEEKKKAMQTFYASRMMRQEEKRRTLAARNLKDSETFLAENQQKEGFQTLPSGLQYKVLTAGKGPRPKAADVVSGHYRGTLINGAEFDSSHKHGAPAKFPVDRGIRGWTEALQLMPVGSTWQLVIPPGLAYAQQAPDVIGPNSALIFEVELLGIEPQQPAQGTAKPATPIAPKTGTPSASSRKSNP